MLMFKALVSFEKFLCESPLHCTFISSFWAKCAADVASCLRCFTGNNHEEERGDVCNCEMLAELKGSTAKSEMTEGEGLI